MTNLSTQKKSQRISGIELLKIIAILSIVISHVTQTLCTPSGSVCFQDYIVKLGVASSNIQIIILNLLLQGGNLGNTIFFACSVWFLVGKTNGASKKAFNLLCSVWVVSMLFLLSYLLFNSSCLTKSDIAFNMIPTCNNNNWYMTCYIIFLFIYPMMNRLIAIVNQKQLLRIVIFTSSLWIIGDYISDRLFFPSTLILWGSIYFLIAYLKLYCNNIISSNKTGITLLIIGIIGYIAQVVVTNYVGLLLSGHSVDILMWNSKRSPFYIMIAIGSIIIALQKKDFSNHFINYISSLTMLMYLIHENTLFKAKTRPLIWHYLYVNYGYTHIVLLDLAFAILLFLVTILVSSIYKETLQRVVSLTANRLYMCISKEYVKLENILLQHSDR